MDSLNAKIYRDLLRTLAASFDWRFHAIIIDRHDKNFSPPAKNGKADWKFYRRWIKQLLMSFVPEKEQAVVVSDYRDRKKDSQWTLSLIRKIPILKARLPANIIQVESEGSVMVQLSDVLLGAHVYRGSNPTDEKYKLKIFIESIFERVAKSGNNGLDEFGVQRYRIIKWVFTPGWKDGE